MINIIEIKDLDAPELQIYYNLNEAQLFHYFEPKPGIFIAESPKVIERALDAGCVPLSFLMEKKHVETQAKEILARCEKLQSRDLTQKSLVYREDEHVIPVYVAEVEVLAKITGYQLTRGMLCAMYRPTLPSVEQLCKNARRVAILENVVNPTNVGAIFRSAAALNIDGIILTSTCSNPLYRRAIRVSMGTVFQIKWTIAHTKKKNINEILHQLGFKTAAMALKEESVNIDNDALMNEDRLAIILGTEGEGLTEETINGSDYTVCIPMSNGVDSLNVAAASAVAFWQLGNK